MQRRRVREKVSDCQIDINTTNSTSQKYCNYDGFIPVHNQNWPVSLIAEFSVESPEFVLYDATKACPEVTTELVSQVNVDEYQLSLFWANGDDLDAFEAAMEDDETVEKFETYTDFGDRRFYRVHISDSVDVVAYPVWVRIGATRLETIGGDGGSWNRYRFPDREAFREFREWCRDKDVEFTLHALYPETESQIGESRSVLTDEQAETLRLAYEEGYFEIPQETTMADIATELEISSQAVSERLHRATKTLVEAYVLDIE